MFATVDGFMEPRWKMLYAKYFDQKKQKGELAKGMEEMKVRMELENCTFKPNIEETKSMYHVQDEHFEISERQQVWQ